jgi:hypothetical protein
MGRDSHEALRFPQRRRRPPRLSSFATSNPEEIVSRLPTLIAAATTALLAPVSASAAAYSYSGLAALQPVHGLAATITQLSVPEVRSGHVAAWVGIGGPGAGPAGEDEWLQVGLGRMYGRRPVLYAEVRSGGHYSFRVLLAPVLAGEPHRVALTEVAPGSWRVVVDGRAVAWRARLDVGLGRRAQVAAESWTSSGACNGLAYRVEAVAARGQGGWRPLRRPFLFHDAPLTVAGSAGTYDLTSRC